MTTYAVTTTDGDSGRASAIYKNEQSARDSMAMRNGKAEEMGLKTRYSVYQDPTPQSPTDLPK